MDSASVSAVILTLNSEKYIEQCIRTLAVDAKVSSTNCEVCVIDGGSTDATLTILKRLAKTHSYLSVVELDTNLGTTVARNIGIRRSRCPDVLFLDSDAEVQEGMLAELKAALHSDDRLGIVAPRLFYPDGSIQASCKRFPILPTKVLKFIPNERARRMGLRTELYSPQLYSPSFRRPVEVDYCISAVWLARRRALEAIGLFDERIFYAPEDVDVCLRMWLAGWRVLYVPEASAIHHTQRVSYRSARMAFTHAKGLIYYFRKHGYCFTRRRIYERIKRANKAGDVD